MQDNIPILATDRLTLRGITLDDFEAYARIWQDETVVRFIGGTPLSREACWARLLRSSGHWRLLGFGFWGIIERETGQLIGEAGYLSLNRDIKPSLQGTFETGWCLMPQYHGHGYAYEAVNTAMSWAERTLPARDFTCIISPDNVPSLNLAKKLGFQKWADTHYNGPITVFRKPFNVQKID